MYVVKNNEELEDFDSQKLAISIELMTKGYEFDIQALIDQTFMGYKDHDSFTSSEIRELIIKSAVSNISLAEPDWQFIAARLFLHQIRAKVRMSFYSGTPYYKVIIPPQNFLADCLQYNRKYTVGLADGFDLDRLCEAIDHSRDHQFTYLGLKTLHDKYLLKDYDKNPAETPQIMFMTIAMFLAMNEEDKTARAIEFYNALSTFKVMLATPILSNARTHRLQLNSCYVGVMGDSIEGITDSFKEMALISKYGGGIGWDFSEIRALGSDIDGVKEAGGGIIPWLRITNDIAIAVNQLGTRQGAIAAWCEIWHRDILDFIDLRKNSGDERMRAHDLFPALWISDVFMERVRDNKIWTLLNPADAKWIVKNLNSQRDWTSRIKDITQDEEAYDLVTCEAKRCGRKVIELPARDLWKKIMTSLYETGTPFLGFKDAANRANPNKHTGQIKSSNLCTEIFQNTKAADYSIHVELEPLFGETNNVVYRQGESIFCYDESNSIQLAQKLNVTDKIIVSGNERKITHIEKKVDQPGKTAVCTLGSINLAKVNTYQDIREVVPTLVRMLDNVISLNTYPISSAVFNHRRTRAIGVGIMGEAECVASKGILFGSADHMGFINNIMESISYNVIKASKNLARERGVYPDFSESQWSKGVFPMDVPNRAADEFIKSYTRDDRDLDCNWAALKREVRFDGLRNGYLMAIAPTSTISILVGTTQSIEPIYKKKWIEENMSGAIPAIVPQYSSRANAYYISAYEVDQINLVRLAAIRQRWIDQGQSLNIFIDPDLINGKTLSDIYMEAWRLGLKSTYYCRSMSPNSCNLDGSCESCQ